MGNCGGALIASDIVLFAAHCDSNTNKAILVGASRLGFPSTKSEFDVGSRNNVNADERFCQNWIKHPNYSSQSQDNDFALCQLNSPGKNI